MRETAAGRPAPGRLFAPLAWLPGGWARDVCLDIDADGTLVRVEAGASPEGALGLNGPALPGMPNLHCHAFQRAMTGLTGHAGAGADSFWSWRELMYRFALAIDPDQLEAIATQVYIELLKGGYTSVCEFHYLHRDPRGETYADPAEMAERLVCAAKSAAIGLTLLPTLYMASGFGGEALRPEQRRFASDPEAVAALLARLLARHGTDPQLAFGIAPHSLRAVPGDALADALAALGAIAPAAPVHIHVAEQSAEVEQCLAWSGRRPVDWLLDRFGVDGRWCLVHATHLSAPEGRRLARSGAVAGLCPTTEADLGDGVFPLVEHARHGGRWGVGSDSNVARDFASELRLLEYSQRLTSNRRNVRTDGPGDSNGSRLFAEALAGGAQASARRIGQLAAGFRADVVVLDARAMGLPDDDPEFVLDALVFGHHPAAVRDVFVGGVQVIESGRHPAEEEAAAAFREAVGALRRSA